MANPNDLAFLAQHPLLSKGDRRSLYTLMAASSRMSQRMTLTNLQGALNRLMAAHGHAPLPCYSR